MVNRKNGVEDLNLDFFDQVLERNQLEEMMIKLMKLKGQCFYCVH